MTARLYLGSMAVTENTGLSAGTPAPAFSLPAIDGETWSLDRLADARALVVVFTCNHCPYAKAYEERLVAIQRDYADRGVRLVAINPNVKTHPQDGIEDMKRRAAARGFNFPYLYDDTQDVARAYDAKCTPDIFVFDAERRFVVNTRVDDSWQNPDAVGETYLRDALDAVLAGTEVGATSPSIGCSIKWAR